ncbi:MAG: pectin esterase [Bacteroidales bacterium]|nr:pectin esterase [Bacteroidales bacterium]
MKRVFPFAALAAWILLSSFTVHLMGDSTMAEKNLANGNPERGWGMMFQNFLDKDVTVVNYAQNGRSTKSFIDLGLWDKVYNAVQPGDYVFIQFGHNDAKQSDSTRYAAPWGAYQDNLRTFVDGVRQKGGTPVLLTPVARRWFKDGKLDKECHGDYPAAMKAVAEEKGVTLLDITTSSLNWLETLGDEASRPYFMNLEPGKWACAPEGKTDNTHTVASGARKVTELVCDGIKEQIPEIAEHLVRYDIVVSPDGHGDYMTVQEAVNAVPNYSHTEITTVFIRKGVYKECVNIPHTKFRVHFIGEDAKNTVITNDNYAKRNWPGRDFAVGTSGSATIYIHASYITFENLTFENSAGEGKDIAQAVAVFTDGDFLFFRNCRFIGNQDTLYTYGRFGKFGGIKRNYFLHCYIEGTTDFIFGTSIAYFDKCRIHSKKNSYVTAASTLQGQKYGYVFKDCVLTADKGIDKCYLGRPWGAYAKTVFIHCKLGPHIVPEGWHDWEKEGKPDTKKNSYYAEYQSYGPGANTEGRVKWSHQLSDKEAAEYTLSKVMYQKEDGILWNPYDNR